MESTHGLSNWSRPSTFSVSRINLTQKSNELSTLSDYFNSLAITPISLRDRTFIKSLLETLNRIIEQTQEIAGFLRINTAYINREHPANLKAEKMTAEVEYYAREANRSLKRLTVRQIGMGETFQLENQITIAVASLNVALSTLCRVLQDASYHVLFFVQAGT
ncbi:MAG: hypothetical protein IPM39_04520 [Chloroflexi bacterium]|nr:hypothetical protein [Chloroflexota bacterium]